MFEINYLLKKNWSREDADYSNSTVKYRPVFTDQSIIQRGYEVHR